MHTLDEGRSCGGWCRCWCWCSSFSNSWYRYANSHICTCKTETAWSNSYCTGSHQFRVCGAQLTSWRYLLASDRCALSCDSNDAAPLLVDNSEEPIDHGVLAPDGARDAGVYDACAAAAAAAAGGGAVSAGVVHDYPRCRWSDQQLLQIDAAAAACGWSAVHPPDPLTASLSTAPGAPQRSCPAHRVIHAPSVGQFGAA